MNILSKAFMSKALKAKRSTNSNGFTKTLAIFEEINLALEFGTC